MISHDESARPGKARRVRMLLAGAASAAVLTISGVVAAQAFTPVHIKHFVECFGWMITDPDTHADNCLPGQILPLESLSSPGGELPQYDYKDDSFDRDTF